jgi:hypothetical protein
VPDERTIHAGCPVEAGEKWGLNIWLRERPRKIPARVRAALALVSAARVQAAGSGLGKAGQQESEGKAGRLGSTRSDEAETVQQGGKAGSACLSTGRTGAPCAEKLPRVCVTLSVRTALRDGPARCGGCGDEDTPLGLCLCRQRYQP